MNFILKLWVGNCIKVYPPGSNCQNKPKFKGAGRFRPENFENTFSRYILCYLQFNSIFKIKKNVDFIPKKPKKLKNAIFLICIFLKVHVTF